MTEIFLIVLCVSLCLGWYVDRSRLSSRLKTYETTLRNSEYFSGLVEESRTQIIESEQK